MEGSADEDHLSGWKRHAAAARDDLRRARVRHATDSTEPPGADLDALMGGEAAGLSEHIVTDYPV